MVLADPDPRIATAAVRTLGDIGDEWAIDVLIPALRKWIGPRSRVAAELERLAPAPGEKLVSLLRDWNPAVRFWGATLRRRLRLVVHCEDIEITFRVHERFLREGRDYEILSDNVATTEAPDSVAKLVAQRERWQRVIDETVVCAVLYDDLQSRMYRKRDLVRVLLLAPLDLVLYRPIMLWARLKRAPGAFSAGTRPGTSSSATCARRRRRAP